MHKEIISQYKASLLMLKDVINKCPENLWYNSNDYENSYWRIVYHILYYTHRYLTGTESGFIAWENHREGYNYLGIPGKDEGLPAVIEDIYTKNDLLNYLEIITNTCEESVHKTPLDSGSGFEWLPTNRAELHIYNIRHLHHHIGQLIERLHQNGIKGIEWVDKS
jgi:hypothetical protein